MSLSNPTLKNRLATSRPASESVANRLASGEKHASVLASGGKLPSQR